MKVLATKAEFDDFINSEKLTVVDFYAEWCGPCKMIGPAVVKMAVEYEGVVLFAKVDVDENEETAEFCVITSMPTFQFYKNGKKVHTMTGANEKLLREHIEKYK